MDYVKLYDLEKYLFEVVHPRFVRERQLSAFDFFCIVIWKANRAKSKVAKLLLAKDKQGRKDLDVIVSDLTASLAAAESDQERTRILIEDWRFRLPIASATACTRPGERILAALGMLNGAPTRFESCRDVSFGGVLCAASRLD